MVYERYTWECTTVDTNVLSDDAFFVLKFPDRQPFFDLDARKVIGGLEKTPAVKAGARLRHGRWHGGWTGSSIRWTSFAAR